MGIPSNHNRNDVLYECWKRGDTIEEASAKTGIPDSTVGYYYKKFDRYAREGSPIPRGAIDKDYSQLDREYNVLKDKLSLSKKVKSLEDEGKYAEARELVLLYEEKRKAGLDSPQLAADIDRHKKDLKNSIARDELKSFIKAAVWTEEDSGRLQHRFDALLFESAKFFSASPRFF